jgi:putative toxin-antitoxin system antitoxin component (TIGR02293 family)
MSEDIDFRKDTVEDALATYVTGLPQYTLQSRLPGGLSHVSFFSDRMRVVKVIREGIPLALFMSIKDMAPFTDQEWSDFLDVSLKSLQRYKGDGEHIFKTIHSEKIIELAEVVSVGQEVFDTNEKFASWLNTPSHALGNMKPIELLRDSYGKEMVLNELYRIDQGIFV